MQYDILAPELASGLCCMETYETRSQSTPRDHHSRRHITVQQCLSLGSLRESAPAAPAVKRYTARRLLIAIPRGWTSRSTPRSHALFHSGGGGYIGLALTSITPENVKDLLAGIGAINAEAMNQDPGLS